MQFATILMSVTPLLLLLERLARGRARYHYAASRGDVVPRFACAARRPPRR